MVELFRVAAFLAIMVLPGALIGFSPLAGPLGAWARLGLSVALSPLVTAGAFLGLRWAGVPVEGVLPILLLLCLPALIILLAAKKAFAWPEPRLLAAGIAAGAVPVVLLLPGILNEGLRSLRAHNFLHADIVNGFLNGRLLPEEMALAGVGNGYPFAAHAFQAAASLALDLAPSSAFVFTNLVFLIALLLLSTLIAKELGGGKLAQATAPLFMTLAVNPLGTLFKEVAGGSVLGAYAGDPRYGAFLRKFYLFNQMTLSYVMLAALMLVALVDDERLGERRRAALMAVLLLAVAAIYPLYMPVAVGIIGARIVAMALAAPRLPIPHIKTEALCSAVFSGAALVLFFLYYEVVTADRASGTGIRLDMSFYVLRKIAHTLVAPALPLAALGYLLFRAWPQRPQKLVMIALVALGLMAMHVLIEIPNWRNEYKFVLALGLILSPLLPVALETFVAGMRRPVQSAIVAGLAAVCILPAALKVSDFTSDDRRLVPVRSEGLGLRLQTDHQLADLVSALGDNTPVDTVIVAPDTGLYLPGFTQRALYVPYRMEGMPQGVGLEIRYLVLQVKGHDRELFRERHETLEALYEGPEAGWEKALAQVQGLERPIAFVLDRRAHDGLSRWLNARSEETIFEGDRYTVFLIET